MAGPYNPPKSGEEFITYIALRDASDPRSFKTNPTIAAADFNQWSDGIDNGTIDTTPTVTPAGSIWVKITLSASEMTGNVISFRAVDQTNPKEWCDFAMTILTTA